MTTPRTIDSFGGVFSDQYPVEDPTVEQSSSYANRLHEDTAQMSRTTIKAIVAFPTSAAGAPVAVTPSAGRSHSGTGGADLPTISKTGTGVYQITWAASFTDSLSVSETRTFTFAAGAVMHASQFGHVQCVVASNVVTAYVVDPAGVATDLGGSVSVVVWAM